MKYHGIVRMTLKEATRHVGVTAETPFFYDSLKRARRERDCGKAYLKVIPKGSRCKLRGTCGRHVEVEHRTLSSTSPTGWNFIVLGPQSWHTGSVLSLSGSWDRRKEGQSGKESWKLCSIRPDRTKWNFNREEILTRWETCTIMERSLIDARSEWYAWALAWKFIVKIYHNVSNVLSLVERFLGKSKCETCVLLFLR